MELEKIEDLLKIDTDSNKAGDNKNLLKKLKQLLKKTNKKEANLEKKAEDMPYEAVSVVGNKCVTVSFNLETKEAVVSDVKVDTRDAGMSNHMATHNATIKLQKLSVKHRGENGE